MIRQTCRSTFGCQHFALNLGWLNPTLYRIVYSNQIVCDEMPEALNPVLAYERLGFENPFKPNLPHPLRVSPGAAATISSNCLSRSADSFHPIFRSPFDFVIAPTIGIRDPSLQSVARSAPPPPLGRPAPPTPPHKHFPLLEFGLSSFSDILSRLALDRLTQSIRRSGNTL